MTAELAAYFARSAVEDARDDVERFEAMLLRHPECAAVAAKVGQAKTILARRVTALADPMGVAYDCHVPL